MASEYRLVFSLHLQHPHLGYAFLGVIFIWGIAGLLFWNRKLAEWVFPEWGREGLRKSLLFWFVPSFFSVIILGSVVGTIVENTDLTDAERRGETVITEGCLKSFHSMSRLVGHDVERLEIGNEAFSYSDSVYTAAFHQPEVAGGPIHADSRVRIQSIGTKIVRLEVADHACPFAPDLTFR